MGNHGDTRNPRKLSPIRSHRIKQNVVCTCPRAPLSLGSEENWRKIPMGVQRDSPKGWTPALEYRALAALASLSPRKVQGEGSV